MTQHSAIRSTGVPIVGVACCIKVIDRAPFHAVFDQYISAVTRWIGAIPLLVPCLGESADQPPSPADLEILLNRLDGLLMPGGPSMIHPAVYGKPMTDDETRRDVRRDATMLPVLRAAIKMELPILAICLGMQEMNCALGGTLHEQVHLLPNAIDHRAPKNVTLPREKYLPAHRISCVEGGYLDQVARDLGLDPRAIEVNSLHEQGIDCLGNGLVVEAYAPDGTIEAIRMAHSRAFALGVQWHPEWYVESNPLNAALFGRFRNAALERMSTAALTGS
jgi:putative glutamine amidotransferase